MTAESSVLLEWALFCLRFCSSSQELRNADVWILGGDFIVKLVEPTAEYSRQIQEYRSEFLECGDSMDGTGDLKQFDDPEAWIDYLNKHKNPLTVPEGRVPSTQFIFLREEDHKIIGMIDIRHSLNEYLEKYGGHIGYSVVPSERRKGYASQMLKTALLKCKELNMDKVLITCADDNKGS